LFNQRYRDILVQVLDNPAEYDDDNDDDDDDDSTNKLHGNLPPITTKAISRPAPIYLPTTSLNAKMPSVVPVPIPPTPISDWSAYARKKRMTTPPTMAEPLEMAALAEAMKGVAFPAAEIAKLFLAQSPHHPALSSTTVAATTSSPTSSPQKPYRRCQCHAECTAEEPPLDSDTEALLREMARVCQEYTETIRSTFDRIERGVSNGPSQRTLALGEETSIGMRKLGPHMMAKMSDATREALTALAWPPQSSPEALALYALKGDDMEKQALRKPFGSPEAIDLHSKAMANRCLAFGIRGEFVAKSEHILGENYLAAGKLDLAARSLIGAMSIRNEHELDGDQRGKRQDAAWTREVYGRVMEAKGNYVAARHVRLTGLLLKRVHCGWHECKVLMGADDFMSCASCRTVFYCSTSCQKKDWSRHRRPCKRMVANIDAHRKASEAEMAREEEEQRGQKQQPRQPSDPESKLRESLVPSARGGFDYPPSVTLLRSMF
jgi:hypothetical protein